MAEKQRKTESTSRLQVLDFERPILELEKRIQDLEELSANTDLDLDEVVPPLRNRLGQLVRDTFHKLGPWQQVQVARHPNRPLTTHYIDFLFDDFLELHGDRAFRDDPAILTGIARFGERRIMVIGHRKGRNLEEKLSCNFGCAHPEGYRKALRKMKLAEKFGLPIIAMINTPGAYPGIGAEERGQAWAIAENLMAMFSLRVPIICVVLGEGGSGGALGIGIGDRILMLEHAYYSVISPEGCAAILWKDAKRASEAALALKLDSGVLRQLAIIDEIVEEPLGAAHRNAEASMSHLGERLEAHLAELEKIPMDRLLAERYEKFRVMGTLFGTESPLAPEPEAAPAEEGAEAEEQPAEE